VQPRSTITPHVAGLRGARQPARLSPVAFLPVNSAVPDADSTAFDSISADDASPSTARPSSSAGHASHSAEPQLTASQSTSFLTVAFASITTVFDSNSTELQLTYFQRYSTLSSQYNSVNSLKTSHRTICPGGRGWGAVVQNKSTVIRTRQPECLYRRPAPLDAESSSSTTSPSPGARNRFSSSPCCRVYRS
jgi:hypothetical protein